MPLMLPCKKCKSNLQLKEKQLHQRYRTLVPITLSSWNAVFLCHQIGMGHPQSAMKIDFHLTNDLISNYGHFMGRLVCMRCSLSCLLTVLTDTSPPKFISFRIRADVAKRFLLAHRSIILSSLGVVLQCQQDRWCSQNHFSRLQRKSITEWCTPFCPANLLLLKPTCDMPYHLSAKVNFTQP